MSAFECGGSGDCLFASICHGLQTLRELTSSKFNALYAHFGEDLLSTAGIRWITAAQIENISHVELLNDILTLRQQETQLWYDEWKLQHCCESANFPS